MIQLIIVLIVVYVIWRIASGILSSAKDFYQQYKFGIKVLFVATFLTMVFIAIFDHEIAFLTFPITYLFAYSWKGIQENKLEKQRKLEWERMQEDLRRQREMDFKREQAEREAQIRREEAESRERMQKEKIKYDEQRRQEERLREQHAMQNRNRAELESYLQQECKHLGPVTEYTLQKAAYAFREKEFPSNVSFESLIKGFLDRCMAEFERIIEHIILNQCRLQPSQEGQLLEAVRNADILNQYTYESSKTPEVLVDKALHTLLDNGILSQIGDKYLVPGAYGAQGGIEKQNEIAFDDL